MIETFLYILGVLLGTALGYAIKAARDKHTQIQIGESETASVQIQVAGDYLIEQIDSISAADVRPVRPCDGCPFCVCEKHGVICPSDPGFRCDIRGGDT